MRHHLRRGQFMAIGILAAGAVVLLYCNDARANDSSPTVEVKYASGDTELDTLKLGGKYFTKRDWTIDKLPEELIGLTFSRRQYAKPATVEIDAPAGSQVYLLTDDEAGPNKRSAGLNKQLVASGWTRLSDAEYTETEVHPLDVFRKQFASAQHLSFKTVAWSGCVVASASLSLGGSGQAVAPTAPPKTPPPTATKQPDDTAAFHPDSSANSPPIVGPTTNVAMPQTSIKSLEVYTQDSGMMLGQTSEVVLTVRPSDSSKLVTVQFVTSIGDEMRLARDEALRFIHVRYPNWNVESAEISFEDKYTKHEGGSIGTAVGTMIVSVIRGFQIDPDLAITGDISANGKVRAIGGVSAKLHGAIASKCTIAAIPLENEGQLVDAVVYNGLSLVSDIQVIGIGSLDDAIATVRIDRDDKLKQAIALFASIQQSIKDKPGFLKSEDALAQLRQVLDLEPHHLSAKVLLSIAQNKQPKTLSAGASLYYMSVAVKPMAAILAERQESRQKNQVPSAAVQAGLADLRKLHPLADPNIRPLLDAWSRFIQAWSSFDQGIGSAQSVQRQGQSLLDEMAKENANADMMQKMVKEGI
jgi:Lon protease (S16) C-terminal proteolytic domain